MTPDTSGAGRRGRRWVVAWVAVVVVAVVVVVVVVVAGAFVCGQRRVRELRFVWGGGGQWRVSHLDRDGGAAVVVVANPGERHAGLCGL